MAQRNNMTRLIGLKYLFISDFDFWRGRRIGSNISGCYTSCWWFHNWYRKKSHVKCVNSRVFRRTNSTNWDDSCREYRHLIRENKIMSILEMLFERKFLFPTYYILCHVSLNFLLLCFSIRQMKSPTNVTLHGGQCKFHYSLALFSSILSISPFSHISSCLLLRIEFQSLMGNCRFFFLKHFLT